MPHQPFATSPLAGATCPPGSPPSAGLVFPPVPRQRALSGRHKRAEPAPDAELLALGREWEASAARERALDQNLGAIEDVNSAAFTSASDAATKESEVGAQLRHRIVQLRATTWPGVLLKIAITTWAYDVDDAEFGDVLNKDSRAINDALTMSLLRDLRTWFAQPDPDAELLRLGALFEAAWQKEAASWTAYQATRRGDPERSALGNRWDADNDATRTIVEKIEKLPATTFAGLVAKTRACSWTHEGEPFDAGFFDGDESADHRLAAAVLRDLMAIDGRPLPTAAPAPAVTKAA